MANPTITMYTSGWCGYCAQARALLKLKGLRWTEIDVDAEPGSRAEMVARSGRRTVPQIFIGELHVGGSKELREFADNGDLDALLTGLTA